MMQKLKDNIKEKMKKGAFLQRRQSTVSMSSVAKTAGGQDALLIMMGKFNDQTSTERLEEAL
jgi:hypothetical protein